jgi:capsular exopolysaccharide synthesis family protein
MQAVIEGPHTKVQAASTMLGVDMNKRYAMQNGAEAQLQDEPLTLLALWKMVRSRRWVVASITLVLLGATIAYCVLCTREYTATAEIQIQTESQQALGLGALTAGDGGGGMSDVLDAARTLQTQAKILESETLALEVVNELGLQHHADFQPRFDPIGTVLSYITPKGIPDPQTESLDEAPARRERIYKVFSKNLKVKPVGGTRLIEVSYTSSDPHVAKATVNKLMDDLVDYNFQTRLKASSQASSWIAGQLADLRGDSEKLQTQAADMQGAEGVYSFGGETNNGRGAAYSTVLDQLQQATLNLTQAQSNRVLRGALYQATKTGDPAMIAGLNSTLLASGQTSAAGSSLSLLQTLRDQEATAKGQLSEMAAKFGPEYPKLGELRANVASIQQDIQDERQRLQGQTESEYEVAQQVEQRMRAIFDQQKQAAQALNSKAVEYEILHHEADESRSLYEHLLGRLKEAGALEGMKPSNISVVEPGRLPAKPAKPNVPLYLAAALVAGLLLGLVTAILLEAMDSKVRDGVLLGDYYGSGLVAELPFERRSQPRGKSLLLLGRTPIFTLADPQSPFSEALRSLRTSVLMTFDQVAHRVILVTSSVSGEGKTTLATNLATSLAQQGKRVLLVDADLRRPRLHALFEISNDFGLGNVLQHERGEAEAIASLQPIADVPGLTVLPAGSVSGSPAELLGSDTMRHFLAACKAHFDYVVLDSEPMLPVTDAMVLTPVADQVLLLARHGVTERSMFEKSLRIVMSGNPHVSLGVVVNAIKAGAENDSHRYQNSYSRVPARVPALGGM